MREVNPALVMISTTGFGHNGPYRDYGAWGWGLECQGGVTFHNGYRGEPDPLCYQPTIHQVLLTRDEQDSGSRPQRPFRFIRSCSSSLAPATMARLEKRLEVNNELAVDFAIRSAQHDRSGGRRLPA